MSPSTTTAASPTQKCSPTRRQQQRSPSSAEQLAFFARRGIHVERVLTDNGSAYSSTLHALACRQLGIRHLRTRPRRPQTNGKAERFIRTLHQRLGLRRHLPLKHTIAPQHLTAGSGTTTIGDDTQPSATNPRSAEPTCLGLTASRPHQSRKLVQAKPHQAEANRGVPTRSIGAPHGREQTPTDKERTGSARARFARSAVSTNRESLK